MNSFIGDLRFSFRQLRKYPGSTAISIVALTLGIGLTTVMFSIVYGALMRGLPFENSHQVMHLERNNLAEDIESMEVTVHDYLDWREQQTTFTDIAAFYQGTMNLSGIDGRPERFNGAFMSGNALALIGARPAIGRIFRDGDEQPGTPWVVLLNHATWQNRFAGDTGLLGATVKLNGETATVIGVMPADFAFPLAEDMWAPWRLDPSNMERGTGVTLEVFGRLPDEVSLDEAYSELATIAKRLEMEYPETNEGVGVVIKPFTEEYIGEEAATLLYTMLAAVFLVLVIACVNVANLLLARAAARGKEVAIRSALGSSRWRVIWQFLSESFLLALGGAIVGLGVAYIGVTLFNNAIADSNPPFWIDIKIDPIAVGFAFALTLAATVLAGLIPAIRASGANVNEILKDEGRGTSSLRMGKISKVLVVAEIALSCGLLVGAGLMIKSVVKLRTVDYGFPTAQMLTARVGLFEGDYPDSIARLQFYDELVARLNSVAGARSAAVASGLPGTGSGGTRFSFEGDSYERDQDYPVARRAWVSPEFFRTFEAGVVQGRGFTTQDAADNLPVVVVNESFARRHSSDQSPIGRRIRSGASDSEQPWRTIVGVVPDMYMAGVDDNDTDPEGFYVPVAQSFVPSFISIAIHAEGDALALVPVLRAQVAAIDPDLPLYWVDTLQGRIEAQTWFYRVFGVLFMIFGFAALFLGAAGLYGVMAFSVSRRTQEIGVRMALGAQPGHVLRMFLRQGVVQLAIGLVFGLGLGALLSRGLEVVLFEVEPFDPTIFAVIAAVLVASGLIANYVPARRATRVDPTMALRYD